MKMILLVISLIWQLPQFILGCLFLLIYRKKITKFEFKNDRIYVYCFSKIGGMGTALFVFLRRDIETMSYEMKGKKRGPDELIKHETGHSIQSLYLGPLYLFVIGIPSVVAFYIFRLFKLKEKNMDFYKFYTESWADYLGGVKWD